MAHLNVSSVLGHQELYNETKHVMGPDNYLLNIMPSPPYFTGQELQVARYRDSTDSIETVQIV
jgi:hypothetical protein